MNTNDLFTALKSFDNRRRNNRNIYLEYVESQERYKGSKAYDENIAAAAAKRKADDDEARKAAEETISDCLRKMQENAGHIALEAPTADMVAILQTLSMRSKENKPSRVMLDMAAQSMNGNMLALTTLDDIADKFYPKTDIHGKPEERFHANYSAMATGINPVQISNILRSIGVAVKEILDSPVNSVFIDHARQRERAYGNKFDIDALPQRKELDEREFYQGIIPADLYSEFMKAVNGQ